MDKEIEGRIELGKQFITASERCFEPKEKQDGKLELPEIPAIVCLSFAVEVLLKVLIKIERHMTNRKHSLRKLFKTLSSKTQVIIREKLNLSEVEFDEKINEARIAFIEWRYIYEYENAKVDTNFLRNLAGEVLNILEQKKESLKPIL